MDKKEEIKRIVRLAFIKITDPEAEKFSNELAGVISMFDTLDNAEDILTEEIKQLAYEKTLRSDRSAEYAWDPFCNSQTNEQGYFRGPKIIREDQK